MYSNNKTITSSSNSCTKWYCPFLINITYTTKTTDKSITHTTWQNNELHSLNTFKMEEWGRWVLHRVNIGDRC